MIPPRQSGNGSPSAPDLEWRILGKDKVVTKWLATDPFPGSVSEVLRWIEAMKLAGPSSNARSLGNEFWIAQVPRTDAFVEYLQVDYERLIILKRITGR